MTRKWCCFLARRVYIACCMHLQVLYSDLVSVGVVVKTRNVVALAK